MSEMNLNMSVKLGKSLSDVTLLLISCNLNTSITYLYTRCDINLQYLNTDAKSIQLTLHYKGIERKKTKFAIHTHTQTYAHKHILNK